MRAQLFSFDFIVSIALIILLLGMAIYVSDKTSEAINSGEGSRQMQNSLSYSLSALVLSPGDPTNWNRMEFSDGNVRSIGLAASPNVLDGRKVVDFFAIAGSSFSNYSALKAILGLNYPSSNFSVTIYDSEGMELYSTEYLPGSDATVYAGERLALLEGEGVRLKMMVWVE
ncbi:MAG: hypothetical protein ABIG96_03130 [Candidatus Micrarchaeota archaeon]